MSDEYRIRISHGTNVDMRNTGLKNHEFFYNTDLNQLILGNASGVLGNGGLLLLGPSTATTATAGAASALPATPAGYFSYTLPNGTIAKIPYYNT
jgi:hypothetical protein